LYELPPFYRSPGLAQRDIEGTLLLTPHHLLLISHRKYPLYIDVEQNAVDEGNRLRCFHGDKELVSWKGETRPYRFEVGKETEDSWEKSPEGKQALERQAALEKQQSESKESDEAERPTTTTAGVPESAEAPAEPTSS
jgi:hypothetical protein